VSELTQKQKEMILHASGLTQSKESYRNHYNTQADDADWLDIVGKGLATGPVQQNDFGGAFFYLTDLGVDVAYGIKRRKAKP
jgi:hypothetical protein